MGQGRRGGDEYAVDEDGPDTTGHSHDYGADDTTQISEAHLDHQVLLWPQFHVAITGSNFLMMDILTTKIP